MIQPLHKSLLYLNNTNFEDPKVSACDPKVGHDSPIEKHWCEQIDDMFGNQKKRGQGKKLGW
jgi:hypothetical protein